MSDVDINETRESLKKEVSGYSAVSTSAFLKNMNELLDIIDYLQNENEELKKQISKPVIKEKIVYRKR